MEQLLKRRALARRIQQERSNLPSRTSEQAYAQLERIRHSTKTKPLVFSGELSSIGRVKAV
jgi:hypothetical protein